MKTLNSIKNLITGNDIKKQLLNPVVLKGFKLPNGHILICRSGSLYHVKNEAGVFLYNANEIKEIYNIELTGEIINKLSIK
jgi:hypothetical protein